MGWSEQAITEADERTRTSITAGVETAKSSPTTEMRRLFGGDHPELLDRLQPLLDKFAVGLQTQARTSTGELLEKAAKQFDPADQSSPMAKHASALAAQHEKVTLLIEKNHTEIGAKVEELTTALRIREAKKDRDGVHHDQTTISTTIRRLLDQAIPALAGTSGDASARTVESGAA